MTFHNPQMVTSGRILNVRECVYDSGDQDLLVSDFNF